MKKSLMQSAIILSLAASAAFISSQVSPITLLEKDPYRLVIQKTNDLSSIQWIDCRPEADFDKAHIPEAILMNSENYEQAFESLMPIYDPEIPLICYCSSSCLVSKQIAQRLRKDLGQENIFYLKGGFDAWSKK